MSSQSTNIATVLPTSFSSTITQSTKRSLPNFIRKGVWSCREENDKSVSWPIRWRCNVGIVPEKRLDDDGKLKPVKCMQVLGSDVKVVEGYEITVNDIESLAIQVSTSSNNIERLVSDIKCILSSLSDGEITISPYDTAWVALLEDPERSSTPIFPSSLRWIAANQLSDGSWGDFNVFKAHDRIINTLACLVALKSWNVYPDKQEKGVAFLEENLSKLRDENSEHMPIGFEVAFPSLVDIAQYLDIDIPCDSLVLEKIYAQRSIKLRRIPMEIMHNVPTTLLHSLEGMASLDWEKLLKLQCGDGSFLFSPASTAYAFMQTKNRKCLSYLKKVVQRFGGGVPNVYPVDLFEHLWTVDRLLRLGIGRYFQQEIKQCLDYVYSYWTEQGICWARNSNIQDIDDTAMGFRLLRLHGHEVSADVFKNFKKDGEFFCFVGQSNQAKSGMYNLYRASQIQYPGERVLEEALKFSLKYLKEKQAINELLDKWIIMKDLPGEVAFALDIPWWANLPRIEARFYIEQYGGEDDVWIGKTLYRMPCVNNNMYLELAKLDYNNCQALHRIEWAIVIRWYEDNDLAQFGLSQRTLLEAYFLAASSIFEPRKLNVRLAWIKTAAIIETITLYFGGAETSIAEKKLFTDEFRLSSANQEFVPNESFEERHGVMRRLLATLDQLAVDTWEVHGRDIRNQLIRAWEKWLIKWQERSVCYEGEAQLLVSTIELTSGYEEHDDLLCHPQYIQISEIADEICQQLANSRRQKDKYISKSTGNGSIISIQNLEERMKELLQLVHQNSADSVDSNIKQIFLAVVKTYYYAAYCSQKTIDQHIAKVLFEEVTVTL